jgi:DNA-binding response OmpR family regulator
VIKVLEDNHCARLIPDSIKYFEELGYPLKSYIKNVKQINNLTNEEKKVLNYLLNNKNKVVSFESIGNIIWEDNDIDKFSLYAISKLIERIRGKLQSNGINYNTLHTQRSSGYALYD